jgi:hypothetical protein
MARVRVPATAPWLLLVRVRGGALTLSTAFPNSASRCKISAGAASGGDGAGVGIGAGAAGGGTGKGAGAGAAAVTIASAFVRTPLTRRVQPRPKVLQVWSPCRKASRSSQIFLMSVLGSERELAAMV